MVSSQIADAEGHERYFIMSNTVKGETTWDIYDRTTGSPVRKGFETKHGATRRCQELNRRAK